MTRFLNKFACMQYVKIHTAVMPRCICISYSDMGVSLRCANLQASRFWAGGSDSDDDEEKATASEAESTDDSSSSDSDAEQKKGPSRLVQPGSHSLALMSRPLSMRHMSALWRMSGLTAAPAWCC